MTLNPYTKLNKKYRVVCPRGKCSDGHVYVVRQEEDQKEFLLKEFSFSSKEEKKKFLEELEIVKKVNHSGLPRVYDSFFENNRDYIVMEYLKGRTLDSIVTELNGNVPVDVAIKWTIEIAEILDYLHTSFPSPVLYGNLKPSHIMLTHKGRLKLIDLSITGYYNPVQSVIPGYAAPEQCSGKKETTFLSDIFSLGAILFQILTGHYPPSTPFRFPDLKSVAPSISEELSSIVMKAIEVEPEKRYKSVKEFRGKLQKHLNFYLSDHKSSPKISIRGTETLSLSKEKFKEAEAQKEKKLTSIQKIVIAIISFLVLAGLFTGKYMLERNKKMAEECKENLNVVKTILEIYAEDNKGKYPFLLSHLIRKNSMSEKFYDTPYIDKVPLCPASGDYEYKTNYETYTVYCKTHRHAEPEEESPLPQSGNDLLKE